MREVENVACVTHMSLKGNVLFEICGRPRVRSLAYDKNREKLLGQVSDC
jgi:hypothetical protein